ncbi:hypothetical protein BDN70DRAFT_880408 [Pholiota conissans]|uniref:Uncharacterized protein n=1 Tax=Pholiota conissans TaxID=109636 RepID=A0A9P5Z237_9AGAR|nr:hypothetical protein BDN70DRAFT_880408 [Pholiota conissans]
MPAKNDDMSSAVASLKAKLTGKELARPRCRTAVNVWRKTHREEIEEQLKRQLGPDLKGKRDRLASERDKIARDMFSKLDLEEQKLWKEKALAEHAKNLEDYQKNVENAERTSTDPADRQRCIQNMVQIIKPILDMVADCTGYQATIIGGGPEPADGGKVKIISIESEIPEKDLAKVSKERDRYQKELVSMFKDFMQQSFTDEYCLSQAIDPFDDEIRPLSIMNLENEFVSLYSLETSDSAPLNMNQQTTSANASLPYEGDSEMPSIMVGNSAATVPVAGIACDTTATPPSNANVPPEPEDDQYRPIPRAISSAPSSVLSSVPSSPPPPSFRILLPAQVARALLPSELSTVPDIPRCPSPIPQSPHEERIPFSPQQETVEQAYDVHMDNASLQHEEVPGNLKTGPDDVEPAHATLQQSNEWEQCDEPESEQCKDEEHLANRCNIGDKLVSSSWIAQTLSVNGIYFD